MDTKSKIAVWIDFRQAILIRFENSNPVTKTVDSGIESHQRIEGEVSDSARFSETGFSNNENRSNNRFENEINSYLNTVIQHISGYDDILVFGPATAKDRLFNMLKDDKSFDQKKIEVKSSDKLTPNQLIAFARDHILES